MNKSEKLQQLVQTLNKTVKSTSMCFVIYEYDTFFSVGIYQKEREDTESVLLNSKEYYDIPALNRKKIEELHNLKRFIVSYYNHINTKYNGDCIKDEYGTRTISIKNLDLKTKYTVMITISQLNKWITDKKLPIVSNFLNGDTYYHMEHDSYLHLALIRKSYIIDGEDVYVMVVY